MLRVSRRLHAKYIEARQCASRLIAMLNIMKSSALSATVQSILRSKISGNEVNSEDFESFVKALNTKVLLPVPHPIQFGLKTRRLNRQAPKRYFTDRNLADALSAFLQCFVETPALNKINPLGNCSRPECAALFLKSRSDQLFCSGECRKLHWSELTRINDPEYWKNRMRVYRKSAKKRSHLRNTRPKI